MCGRFTNHMSWREIHDRYVGKWRPPYRPPLRALNLPPRSDIRPTTDVVIIRTDVEGDREAVSARWSLVPPWAEDLKQTYAMHNARADSIAEKPSFREAFKKRRCLIPASGFYEWKTIDGTGKKAIKVRHYITSKSGEPLTFAGLWEINKQLNVESCTMVCTDPNELMAPIHDRMPVILAESDWESWLAEPRLDLLKPAPVDDLIAYPVRSDIKDDDPLESLREA
jgi:putative SOS response-associated peptidase YedK